MCRDYLKLRTRSNVESYSKPIYMTPVEAARVLNFENPLFPEFQRILVHRKANQTSAFQLRHLLPFRALELNETGVKKKPSTEPTRPTCIHPTAATFSRDLKSGSAHSTRCVQKETGACQDFRGFGFRVSGCGVRVECSAAPSHTRLPKLCTVESGMLDSSKQKSPVRRARTVAKLQGVSIAKSSLPPSTSIGPYE